MAIINKKYPFFLEDKDGKWKYYSDTFKILIEPSEEYILNNPPEEIEEVPNDIEILQADNKKLNAKIQALTESNSFLEECLVEMAEIVYA